MEMPVPNAAILDRRDEIVSGLVDILGPDGVISAPEEVKAYECDALTAYRCPPLAAVLPRTTEEVAAIVTTGSTRSRRYSRPSPPSSYRKC